ncbi:phage integrase family protein [Chryseobacterium nematophagum]|nr:phage integrase family protein [Chryseobacterium nematophagum]
MKKELIKLANGCERTEVYISPKNYKTFTSKSKIPKQWFVECRFYDPKKENEYPKGFQYRKKFSGTDLQGLKLFAKIYKEEMELKLDVQKFNPITKEYMHENQSNLNPYMNFIKALWVVRDKIPFSKAYLGLSRQLLNKIEKVLPELAYSYLKIGETKTWHIKNILEAINTTNSVFNKYRSCLSTMFKELLEYGCVEFNPVSPVSKKMEVPKIRQLLSDRKKSIVLQYLHDNYPEFYRYASIFFFSGARSSELLRVQAKYVDIQNQEYKVLIKKRRTYVWDTKIIIPAAIPYWNQILLESKNEEDYIFSKGLRPGLIPIKAYQITKRWKRNVKDSNEIKDPTDNRKIIKVIEDFYSFKHLFLDKLDELQNSGEPSTMPINFAQGMANHLSPETTNKYTIGKNDRKKEALKKISIK